MYERAAILRTPIGYYDSNDYYVKVLWDLEQNHFSF